MFFNRKQKQLEQEQLAELDALQAQYRASSIQSLVKELDNCLFALDSTIEKDYVLCVVQELLKCFEHCKNCDEKEFVINDETKLVFDEKVKRLTLKSI